MKKVISLLLALVLCLSLCACGKDAVNSTGQQEASDRFVEDVKAAISGAIDSDNEAITDVVMNGKNLCVSVDLSSANPEPLTMEDLAFSRTGSITDAILTLTNYDNQWDTITIDFGEIGKITNRKADVKENGYGGRFFPSANFVLE